MSNNTNHISMQFCNSEFWNHSLTWDTDSPRLTDCFAETVLPVIPVSALIALLPYDWYIVRKYGSKLSPIPYQWKNILHLLSISCLIIIQTISLSKTLWNQFSNEINLLTISQYFCPSVKLLTYLLVAILVFTFRRYDCRHLTSLPILWLFSLIVITIDLYQVFSNKQKNIDVFEAVLKCLELLFTTKALIVSSLTPKLSTFHLLDTEDRPKCPMTDFNVFRRIGFLWLTRVLKHGYKTEADLGQYLLPNCHYLQTKSAAEAFETADKKYNKNRRQESKLLLILLWSVACVPYFGVMVINVFAIAADFSQPLFLSKLLDIVSGVDKHLWHGVVYALIYCLLSQAVSLFDCHGYQFCVYVAFRVRMALTNAIYKKMLTLSAGARREYTSGEINNLMGVDIPEISSFFRTSFNLFNIPFAIAIGLYLLWQQLGPSSMTLIGVILVVGPLTTLIFKKIDQIQTKHMELKDQRTKQLSEIFNNIKLLKLFGWELPFINRVSDTRDKELHQQNLQNYLWSAIEVIWYVAPMMTAAISFVIYTLTSSHPLTAKTAFVSLNIFNLLRGPVVRFPYILAHLVRAVVSYKRIRKYLAAEEMEDNFDENDSFKNEKEVVSLKDCSFLWNVDEEPVLKDISLSVKKGSLVAIVGRVGAGKSSLFSALMGDMYRRGGRQSRLSGSVGYVPQTAWIQNTSLKKNVTFVSDFDQSKYDNVIKSCALEPDFDLLPARDQTEIGEKGINLSGGQKQRVSLARAVYHDSDIYLLDDPLSAVDAHVAQQLFQEVIGPKGLLKRKTRLLATHNLSFLKDMDQIIVMSDGRIIGIGSYEEMSEKGLLSDQLINAPPDEPSMASGDNVKRRTSRISESESIASTLSLRLSRELSRQISKGKDIPETDKGLKERLEMEAKKAEEAKLIEEEYQQFGKVKLSVYWDYFRRIGPLFTVFPLMAAFGYNICEVGGNYFLSIWTSKNETEMADPSHRTTFFSVYMSTILLNSIFVVFTQVVFRVGTIKAAAKLHRDMLWCVMRTPMKFFNTTPLGRIINRFNHDITNIDEEIPFSVLETVSNMIWFFVILCVILYNNPYLAIQVVVVTVIFSFLYKVYLWTSRQLYRLDSITRSPVYSHFNECLSGVSSLRAYNVQNVFTERLQNLMDINMNYNKYLNSVINWVDLYVTLVGSIITLSTALLVVLERDRMTAGLAGFILVYSIQIINSIAWALRNAADLENQMVSIERIKEYSEIEPEADWDSTEQTKPPPNWPNNAKIEFIDYSTTYREGLEPVLKNINLKIESGEKVGIVGRTGAGKSSITMALFRIIEPTDGRIVIDGVDITRIGLHDLRKKITIIPQEPNLFAGTLRLNLDPFEEYTDEELWSALESSHLKEFVSSNSDGLSYEITEGGDNLSAGQRQLVCLARALLRRTKILVLDEATAACDLETDLLIQSTIKEKFNDCTVMTIAHRLNTVLDYNSIVVLDNGVIVERDSPNNLLANKDSVFYGLAKEFGIV